MTQYTAENPINVQAKEVLLALGATVEGQEISHPDLEVERTETWAGAWRGYWMKVNEVTIGDVRFLDDSNYESFRLSSMERAEVDRFIQSHSIAK